VHDGLRTRLRGMLPGEVEAVRFAVAAPAQAGDYVLEVDLVYEAVGWFGDHGSATLRRPVAIVEGP
jgi:hypothetical protein